MEKYITISVGILVAWFMFRLIYQIVKLIVMWFKYKISNLKGLKIWD